MKQQTVKQFTPFFSPKTRQESYTPGRGAGHKFYCHKCGEFRVHSIEMVGNGTPILRSKCRYCGSYDEFIRAGGQWVPSSVVELLDSFVMKEMDKKSAEMWSEVKLVDEDGITTTGHGQKGVGCLGKSWIFAVPHGSEILTDRIAKGQ